MSHTAISIQFSMEMMMYVVPYFMPSIFELPVSAGMVQRPLPTAIRNAALLMINNHLL